ncbi:YiiX/YebB-like N1pC/P60 family cysteine hydrolase [Stenoxybacter acetivorans]|uniref:YiiX/YebB-like N1pC/P60 family cysteine hydrolase n=1 Tax=Stenoxybacter acetivorans TaxID=422441 RepID=UPI000567F720|nr:YiiX/YebB-like N1pC/P60 family cysteine hydrolase [Stenoxybacter acetivorans]
MRFDTMYSICSGCLKRLVLIMVCALGLTACAVSIHTASPNTEQQADVIDEIKPILQHGDWLVVRGVHATDDFVSAVTNAPLSHAAVYDAENQEVIEAEGIGVHSTPLADFIAKSQRVMIIRSQWHTPENAVQAVKRARSHIGKRYNLSGLIGINTPDTYYCTQLVVDAYTAGKRAETVNPLPPVILPRQMFHWGRIVYDSGVGLRE